MIEYCNTLEQAVSEAIKRGKQRLQNGEVTNLSYLMAQRRAMNDGSFTWAVEISDKFDQATMVHLYEHVTLCDEDETEEGLQVEIAEFKNIIEIDWDEAWDAFQVENPVGDFSVTSSDFQKFAA